MEVLERHKQQLDTSGVPLNNSSRVANRDRPLHLKNDFFKIKVSQKKYASKPAIAILFSNVTKRLNSKIQKLKHQEDTQR